MIVFEKNVRSARPATNATMILIIVLRLFFMFDPPLLDSRSRDTFYQVFLTPEEYQKGRYHIYC